MSMSQSKVISVTPTLDTNAYADADRMGSIMTLSNVFEVSSGGGVLKSVAIVDKGKVKKDFDILLFSGLPTVASADNAALDITDAMMASYYLGTVAVTTEDFKDIANSSVAAIKNINLGVQSTGPDNQALYAICIAREAQTYAATDLTIKFGFTVA